MREIKLNHGFVTIVDDEDFEWLNSYKWCAHKSKGGFYALRGARLSEGLGIRTVYMARFIMQAPAGMKVDHRNGNSLDNRRENLRICNHSENMQNRKHHSNSTSLYKGIHRNGTGWEARIQNNNKLYYFGTYHTQLEAAVAYDKGALLINGEFANINFPKLVENLCQTS